MVAVAPIKPSNETEMRRFAAAEVRKKLGQEFTQQFTELRTSANISL